MQLTLFCRGILALCCALPLAPLHASTPLTLITHSVGGQAEQREDGLHGFPGGGSRAFYIELVRAIQAELKAPAPIVEVPFARGLRMVQTESNIVFFNLIRTPEREQSVLWVGPISRQTDYLYARAGHGAGIRTLADARTRSICVLAGSVHEQAVRSAGFQQVHTTSSYANCFRMLVAGHVELTASASDTVDQKLREAELKPASIRRTPVVLSRTDGYIAFSSDVAAKEVERWRQTLHKLQKNGRYEALRERYAAPQP